MEDIMEDNFEKLNLLLEQEQCEFVDIPDGFTGQTESGELRLIYLMNEAGGKFSGSEKCQDDGKLCQGLRRRV